MMREPRTSIVLYTKPRNMYFKTLTNRASLRSFVLGPLLLVAVLVHAQKYVLVPAESKVTLTGTSTLHDWESELMKFTLAIHVTNNVVSNIVFQAPVRSLKSGNKSMDKNTYEALKADAFPNITFKGGDFRMDGHKVSGTGALTVAGVTKQITMEAGFESWKEGAYVIVGEFTFNMTDHDVQPPSVVFGTIKTGDAITLHYSITVKRK